MKEQAACSDCPLRWMRPGWLEQMEYQRLHLDNKDDRQRIATCPSALPLFVALSFDRPARCDTLRDILPTPVQSNPFQRPVAMCPEMGAVALVYTDVPFPET